MGYITGDYKVYGVRAAAVLTGSYVAGTDIADVYNYNQLVVEADFTLGSLTSAEIKVEYSQDGTNFFQETFSSISGGTDSLTIGAHQMMGTGKYMISLPLLSKIVRISAKGTGTVTGSSLSLRAILGNV